MSSMVLPYVWCILQVALISVISIVVSQTVMRRHPALASGVTASGAITILMVTVLVPAPLPQLSLPQAMGRAIGGQAVSKSHMPLSLGASTTPASTNSQPALLDLRALLSSLFRRTAGSPESSRFDYLVVRCLTIFVPALFCWGC